MRFDALDRAAWLSAAALALATGIVVLRGDQVGLRLVRAQPGSDAQSVSTRAPIVLTLSEPVDGATLEGRIQVEPFISGTLRWSGATVIWTPAQPLQLDQQYTVTLQAGVRSQRGRALQADVRWSFRTGSLRALWLSPSEGATNLYRLDLSRPDAAPEVLTQEPFGVYDYAVSPDGRYVIYGVNREANNPERDLWLLDLNTGERRLAVRCDGEVCQAPSWSADSARVAFERRALILGTVGRSPGPGRIWILDVERGEATPLFTDPQRIGSLPRFAPRGGKLAFYDPRQSAVTVIDTESGDQQQLPSVLGDSGAWSPDGARLIYPELLPFEAGQYSQLLLADFRAAIVAPLLPISASNDSGAAWSPLGDWIAFGRQPGAGSGSALGVHVWRARSDGSAPAEPIAEEVGQSYGAVSWSPDGKWLLAQRFDLTAINAKPEIWLIKADGSERRLLARDALLPSWMP
ncbi:MAG: Ig-like domain-containing protein [Anaerolineae bacterium]|nr:Ig-like domain-containing protein [Anaerolineae bacterium]